MVEDSRVSQKDVTDKHYKANYLIKEKNDEFRLIKSHCHADLHVISV